MKPSEKGYRDDAGVDKRSNKGDLPGQMMDPDDLDSPVNTRFDPEQADEKGSLTIQESPDTDPNEVPDKPSFNRNK